ncbi:MAG: Arm DNA-binding domain-containing protein [Pseudomonadota bacterium]
MLADSTRKDAKCAEGKATIRFTDRVGLYLEVALNGSKRWLWKYLFEGNEMRLALGQCRPAKQRQLDKPERKTQHGGTLEAVAREFHGVKIASLTP